MKNKKEQKINYYSLKNILEKKARYNVILVNVQTVKHTPY